MKAEPTPRVMKALELRLQGESWRRVAERMGEKDHVQLYKDCRGFDMALKHGEQFEALRRSVTDAALEATAQLRDRLAAGDAGDMSTPQLAVVTGILADKVERLSKPQISAGDPQSLVAQLLGSLQGSSGKASLTLEVETSAAPDSRAVTIDVEAS